MSECGEGPPLPQVLAATLDRATVEQLFSDLADHATAVEVLLKRDPRALAAESSATLDEARLALDDPEVRGVQLRYHAVGDAWIDTLMRAEGGGYRLVRMAAPREP